MGHKTVENKIGVPGFLDFWPFFYFFPRKFCVFFLFLKNLHIIWPSPISVQGVSFRPSHPYGHFEWFWAQNKPIFWPPEPFFWDPNSKVMVQWSLSWIIITFSWITPLFVLQTLKGRWVLKTRDNEDFKNDPTFEIWAKISRVMAMLIGYYAMRVFFLLGTI